ncbi:response regulator [Paenibacillus lutrae]|uniref:Response regulator n=1 Tax=Paenibacillus lutrae TaxID=2078573 RepID=A0A7X3K1Z1_9BACL|nr:response regulator [Paenibacillus lutrae]MVP02436.1 response regulator [Paenibacillus lutrae]
MKAILIDDEKPALLHLERLIEQDGRIGVAATFTSAKAGLDYLSGHPVDIVFLDIGMPEMNGLEAAEQIQQLNRDVRIVYITASSDHAIEAFELYALDYLLKPVHAARFAKTLDRIEDSLGGQNPKSAARKEWNKPAVLSFQRLTPLYGDPKASGTKKWRTLKAQELFAYLLHYKGQWVPKTRILDTVWPEYAPDKAMTHLHTSIYQIRKQLKEWGVLSTVEFGLNSYRLKQEGMLTDADLFERVSEEPIRTEQEREQAESVLALYKGDYLEEHDYSWAQPRKDELHQRYVQLVHALAEYDLDHGRAKEAIQRLSVLQKEDPYSDEVCRLFLHAYAQLKDMHLLRHHYESFQELLDADLGVAPAPQTIQCFRKLTSES